MDLTDLFKTRRSGREPKTSHLRNERAHPDALEQWRLGQSSILSRMDDSHPQKTVWNLSGAVPHSHWTQFVRADPSRLFVSCALLICSLTLLACLTPYPFGVLASSDLSLFLLGLRSALAAHSFGTLMSFHMACSQRRTT
jgi:hypothetical protein